jgi:hypothetical protein
MKVQFTKVDASDPAVAQLAQVTGAKPTEVAAMINQQRYRTAYNKAKMEEVKVLRQLVKEHPELLKEVK